LAISQRGALNEIVTDALVELGNREVVLNALDNFGASFSNRGFSVLVSRSQGDDFFAELVGSRPEIPSDLLVALVAKASQDVRSKLEAAHPRAKASALRAVSTTRAPRAANCRQISKPMPRLPPVTTTTGSPPARATALTPCAAA